MADVKFIKADTRLGLAFGWAMCSTIDGEP